MSTVQPQTPRRSGRHLPLATPSTKWKDLYRAWCGDPLYIRPVNLGLDDVDEETRQEADEVGEELETVFYKSFEMKNRLSRSKVLTKKKQTAGESSDITTYTVGDTILVETDGISLEHHPPDVGVILYMWETRIKGSTDEPDPNRMRIRVHWFVQPWKFRKSFGGKRDHTKNEAYYTLEGQLVIVPVTIVGPCHVTSREPAKMVVKSADAWAASSTKKRRGASWMYEGEGEDANKGGHSHIFFCRFAKHAGLYFDFNWERHYATASESMINPPEGVDLEWGSGAMWKLDTVTPARKSPSSPKKRVKLDVDDGSRSDSDGDATEDEYITEGEGEDEDDLPQVMDENRSDDIDTDNEHAMSVPIVTKTPSKKRKRGRPTSPTKQSTTVATPRKARAKTVVHPTPHSKASLKRRGKGKGSSMNNKFSIQPQTLSYATHDLSHLPKDPWLRSMHALHVGSRPDALPCRDEEFEKVLRSVGELLEEGSGGCVYIAGTPGTGKTATVHAVVRQLKRMAESGETNPFTYVEINGLKIPEPAAAYNLLWEDLSRHDIETEGRLRLSPKESLKALTSHFSGSGRRGPESHACVVLMDELDQLLTTKQDVVYNFFNWPTLVGSKLIVIAVANTMDLPERVMSGRVRSRLGMVRINFSTYSATQLQQIVNARLQTVKDGLEEVAQEALSADAIKLAAMKVSSISGDARRVLDICRRTVELVMPDRKTARAPDVKEVIRVMQNSPTAAYLRELSFHERLMLASLIKCIKREGVGEINWEEVKHQHLIYMSVLTSASDPTRKPTPNELDLVLDSLVASRAMIIEEGVVASRKPDGERKVALILNQNEVERVLSDVGGTMWKNVLST